MDASRVDSLLGEQRLAPTNLARGDAPGERAFEHTSA